MEIKIINSNKKEYLDLLLLADEQESMIDKYLDRGELFALYDGDLKSVCVVTRESEEVCELKNIATYEKWQGRGYGSKLIDYVCSHYKDTCKTMLVGTGDVPWSIRFYEKNGFRISHRIKGFFTVNYDHPIYDSGILLADMVYLAKELR